MKQIEPISIWKNGESQEATILNAYIINDNLQSCCTFYYQLCLSGEPTEETPLVISQTLADGNVTISGDDYLAWGGANDYAFSYIAEKLNLTII